MNNLPKVSFLPQKLNNIAKVSVFGQPLASSNRLSAIKESKNYTSEYVPHLTIEDVKRMVVPLKERDRLLITFMFDTCFRVSEALSIRPCDIKQTSDRCRIKVVGKGEKYREVAVSGSMAGQVKSYAYDNNIGQSDFLFDIKRSRVWQIVSEAMDLAGIAKPEGVGVVHVLRHSGAIDLLMRTGNPRAVQHQLGHSSVRMTLKYLTTLAIEESLAINSSIDRGW